MAITLKITPTRSIFDGGKFDTNNQYVRQVANPADAVLTIVRGPSIDITTARWRSSNNFDFSQVYVWAYRCGNAVVVGDIYDPPTSDVVPPTGFNTPIKIAL